jgi:hypothetical protein
MLLLHTILTVSSYTLFLPTPYTRKQLQKALILVRLDQFINHTHFNSIIVTATSGVSKGNVFLIWGRGMGRRPH